MDATSATRAALHRLLDRHDLDEAATTAAMTWLLDGEPDAALAAALLTAWRSKGESASELAAAALALRTRMTPFDTAGRAVLDTCGMGGDGAGTFNISTAVAFVVAAAGVPVVKHGNRAVSGNSGSSDVLVALGLPAVADPTWPRRSFDQHGIAFCHAPDYHPALVRLARLRRALGFRTILNCLGPLVNPARPAFQIIGLARPELLDTYAAAVQRIGTQRTVLACGADGLDEVTLAGPTHVRIITSNGVETTTWQPADFGLNIVPVEAVRVVGVPHSAAVIRAVLAGERGPPRDYVLANAAAALWAAGHVPDLRAGREMAERAIDSGMAAVLINQLVH